MLDDTVLADPTALAALDSGGVLRSAATAGAQVRSVAQAAAEAGVGTLAGFRPRALVLLSRPGISEFSTPLLAALLGSSCPVPVVMADVAPSWIGALDLMVAHTADPNDVELADSIARAVRRGCEVVLSAPAEGPVAFAGAGAVRLLEPRVPVPPGLDLPRALSTGLVAVAAVSLLSTELTGADLDSLADELDREAERNQPAHEPFVNPAKSLALRLADRTPLMWGTDPVAAVVADCAAASLAAHAGVIAHSADVAQAATATALLRVLAKAGDTDIFHDPFDDPDGGDGVPQPRLMLLGTEDEEPVGAALRRAGRTWPSADVVQLLEEVPPGTRHSAMIRAALLATRFDIAALYLGLARSVIGGDQSGARQLPEPA